MRHLSKVSYGAWLAGARRRIARPASACHTTSRLVLSLYWQKIVSILAVVMPHGTGKIARVVQDSGGATVRASGEQVGGSIIAALAPTQSVQYLLRVHCWRSSRGKDRAHAFARKRTIPLRA